jgi:hypothetical protein
LLAKAEAQAATANVKTQTILVETRGYGVADVILRQAVNLGRISSSWARTGGEGLARLVMGSDAEGVVRETNVPVIARARPGRASGPAPSTRARLKQSASLEFDPLARQRMAGTPINRGNVMPDHETNTDLLLKNLATQSGQAKPRRARDSA